MSISQEKIKQLEKKANEIRRTVIEALVNADSGHTAGSLGMADIFAYLFFHALNHDPKKPNWSERDRLIISNGHICPVLYAAMAQVGYFPIKNLVNGFRKFGSPLHSHPPPPIFATFETRLG